MFTIQKKKFGTYDLYKLQNTKTKEEVSVVPGFGGNINKIILRKDNKLYSVLDGDKDATTMKKNKWFKGAKLFPYPNRTKNGTYTYKRKTYHLPINFSSQQHAIHGLVYDKAFDITKRTATKTKASITLKYTCNNLPGYPFKATINITYTLDTKGFTCKTTITNKDKQTIPIGDGWHPYFTLGGRVDRLQLQLPTTTKINVTKRMIPTGKTTPFKKYAKLTTIGTQTFDTGFKINTRKKIAETLLHNPKTNTTLHVWQEAQKKQYNYIQIFIPPTRTTIAIEPMTCNTNALNNKKGIIILQPKETFNAKYGVQLK